MKLSFQNDRVLAVVAHPDDAELLCAGTLLRAAADGAAIGLCVLCRGDKGQPARPVKNLAAVRRRELQAAAKILGGEVFPGGCNDGELADGNTERRRLVEVYRTFRPTLVLAHCPVDYHTDHRAAAALAETVSWSCASHGYRTGLPPLATSPALWWMDTILMHQFTPDFYIDVSAHLPAKERMLACHRSQLARGKDGDFSPLLTVMRQQCEARGAQAGVAAAEAFRVHAAFKRLRAW